MEVVVNIPKVVAPAAAGGATEAGALAAAKAGGLAASVETTGLRALQTAENAVGVPDAIGIIQKETTGITKGVEILEQGIGDPERAMLEFVGRENIEMQTPTTETLLPGESPVEITPLSTEIQQSSAEHMQAWDKNNVPPDPRTEPDKYIDWMKNRRVEDKSFIVNEQLANNMKLWESEHTPPADTQSSDYKEWLAERNKYEAQRKDLFENQFDLRESQQAKEKGGMSEVEFMEKYNQLMLLRSQRDGLAQNLIALRASSNQNDVTRDSILKAEDTLRLLDTNIGTLQSVLLVDQIQSKSLMKSLVIPVAIGLSAVSGPVEQVASEGVDK